MKYGITFIGYMRSNLEEGVNEVSEEVWEVELENEYFLFTLKKKTKFKKKKKNMC